MIVNLVESDLVCLETLSSLDNDLDFLSIGVPFVAMRFKAKFSENELQDRWGEK